MKTRIFLSALFLSSPVVGYALPAFYGAAGGGALAEGGRGGVVCAVTSLADSGPGTLRGCIDTHNNTNGSRMTVVFRVGGAINLRAQLTIRKPYITIAGHTAPGGGILLNGKELCYPQTNGWASTLRTIADHVIIRYLKVRKGKCPEPPHRGGRVDVTAKAKHVIIDHISVAWTEAGGMSVMLQNLDGMSAETAPKNITYSYSIMAEPLGEGSYGWTAFGTGGQPGGGLWSVGMTDIDLHNNFFANFSHRGPLTDHARGRVVNNIFYNWSNYVNQFSQPIMDVIGNRYKQGPTGDKSQQAEITVPLYHPDTCNTISQYKVPSLYVAGNKGHWHNISNPDDDNWPMVKQVRCQNREIVGDLSRQHQRLTPLPPNPVPIIARHVNDLEDYLLPIVGASRRLDCMGNWVFNRDAVDTRIIYGYHNNQGISRVVHEDEVGGFPTIAGGTPCQDTDGDGMPDEWEIAMGLNPNDPSDRNTVHASGYTMLEMYLNGPMTTNTTITTPANVRFVQ